MDKGLNLRTICGALARVKTKWFVIGIQLGIPRSKLKEFEEERDPFSAVLDYWLNGNVTDPDVPVSWKTIVKALKSEYVEESGLAEEISKSYCLQSSTTLTDDTTETEDTTKRDDITNAERYTHKTDQDNTKTDQDIMTDWDSMKTNQNADQDTTITDQDAIKTDLDATDATKANQNVTRTDQDSTQKDKSSSKTTHNATKTDEDATKSDQETTETKDDDGDGDDDDYVDDDNDNESSPSSGSSSLDSDVELDLKQQLDLNRRQIEKRYAFYVATIQAILIKRGISARILSSFLLNLPASTTDDEKKLKLLADMKAELSSAEDVVDIFIVLSSKYASFLNPDIYVSILEMFGSKEEQKEQDYPKHLKDFVKQHKIKEFVKMYPKLVNPKLLKLSGNSKKMRIKFNISRTQSLSTLQEVIGAVANVLGLRTSTLRLYGVKKGCVLVTLLIPTSIADAYFTRNTVFSPEQKLGFSAASVLWLECNGHKFDLREKDEPMDTPGDHATLTSPQPGCVEKVRRQLMGMYGNLDRLESAQTTPLHSAVESCDTDNVRYLLKGPEVKLQTSTVKPKLPKALMPKLLEKITGGFEGSNMLKRLGILKKVVKNVHADANKFETTPLHKATESHDVGKIREVLGQAEYSVNSTDSVGWTPLHYACAVGNLDMVRMLVSEFGADIISKDEDDFTALELAALAGHDYVVYALLSEYQCPGVNDALFMACAGGHISMARTLICKYNADLNARDSNNAPLHMAARCGKDEVVQTLIKEFGCNTKVRDQVGSTLLHSACSGGSVNLVRTLVCEHHADVNAKNDYHNTPLHVAAMFAKDEIVLTLIKEFGCDIKVKGEKGRSLLHSACRGGSINLIRTLIREYNVDINAVDDHNDTPLHLAALFAKDEVALTLIKEFGCDTKVKGHYNMSLLHSACEGGCVNLLQTLILEHNADINAINDHNNTPLDVAALFGQDKVVDILRTKFGCEH